MARGSGASTSCIMIIIYDLHRDSLALSLNNLTKPLVQRRRYFAGALARFGPRFLSLRFTGFVA